MSDHNKEWDGIKCADNKLPTWYTISFIGTIIFAVVYIIYYHFATDWSQAKQYQNEVKAHVEVYGAPQTATVAGGGNPLRGNAAAIAAGETVFKQNCAACHKADATGLIGPNLTDATWLHGGTEAEIFNTVMNGIDAQHTKQNPSKGPMPSWKAALGAEKVHQVMAWLESSFKNIQPSDTAR